MPSAGTELVVYFAIASLVICVGLFLCFNWLTTTFPFKNPVEYSVTVPFKNSDFSAGMPPNGYVIPGYKFDVSPKA